MTFISVYETNLNTKTEILNIQCFLNDIKAIKQWNFDLEVGGNILRVESPDSVDEKIMDSFHKRIICVLKFFKRIIYLMRRIFTKESFYTFFLHK
ncbi:hypothetical protein [Flavivirga sp. 57AJ16]|uniref:hypothetical protein n=1 Tax=Flavivirga sp. 57AJ16 TaxID=3025307 RepID=UPI0023673642|nr:hypothetical protein [Flavivirga sp. 57AJ16]MDD7885069.1 hypothetical protein [Flavivirga sp. 57AJ16]